MVIRLIMLYINSYHYDISSLYVWLGPAPTEVTTSVAYHMYFSGNS